MADHNDPIAVNTIFSDIDVSAADSTTSLASPAMTPKAMGKVVVALTFAAVPRAGTLDSDMLYCVQISPGQRITR